MVSMGHRVQLIDMKTPAGTSDAQLNEPVTGAQPTPLGPTLPLDRPFTVPSTPRSTSQQEYTVNRGDVLAAGSKIVKKLEKRESDKNVRKDEVAAWLDEHKVRVLPGEIKDRVELWGRRFTPPHPVVSWITKASADLTEYSHTTTELLPHEPLGTLEMVIHPLHDLVEHAKTLEPDTRRRFEAMARNLVDLTDLYTMQHEWSQGKMKELTEVLSKALHYFKVCVNQEGNSVNMDEVRQAIHIMNTSINDMNNGITMSMESPAKKRKLELSSSEDHTEQRRADLQKLVDEWVRSSDPLNEVTRRDVGDDQGSKSVQQAALDEEQWVSFMQQDGTFPTYQLMSVSRNDKFVTVVLASANVNANPSGVGDRGQEATTPNRNDYTVIYALRSIEKYKIMSDGLGNADLRRAISSLVKFRWVSTGCERLLSLRYSKIESFHTLIRHTPQGNLPMRSLVPKAAPWLTRSRQDNQPTHSHLKTSLSRNTSSTLLLHRSLNTYSPVVIIDTFRICQKVADTLEDSMDTAERTFASSV
ncbi:hypothetical protein BKA56DRAFT_684393 [Ilyonectria sp. MPI-CAGE-AT-0026]|nr:hypothetical protein BKA56DRAFT_684393 [Ilyonectria sp. MPI-CAGE-AT-0026]